MPFYEPKLPMVKPVYFRGRGTLDPAHMNPGPEYNPPGSVSVKVEAEDYVRRLLVPRVSKLGSSSKSTSNSSQSASKSSSSLSSSSIQSSHSGIRETEADLITAMKDPVLFCEKILGVSPWGVQREVLLALREPNARVAIKACHASGKTWLAGQGVVWFMNRYGGAITPTTAPTWAQVKNLLWKEIAVAANKAKIQFPPVRTTDWRFSKSHYATGISTKEAERFQGFHAPNILMVIDEAPGVAEEIWTAIEAIESGGDVRILALGNPTITSGRFYNAFNRDRNQWKTFTVDAFDTPNFVDIPGKTWQEKLEYLTWCKTHNSGFLDEGPSPYLTTRRWVQRRSEDWGVDSPLWTARVRGQFPTQSATSLIGLNDAEAMLNVPAKTGAHVVGCDVARYGINFTSYCEMFGNQIHKLWKRQHRDTTATARELQRIYKNDPSLIIVVDDVGVGGGVTDQLRDWDIPVIPFNAGTEVTYNDDMANRGSEAYWELAQALKGREISLDEEVDLNIIDELVAQMVQIEYKFNNRNKIQVMKKGLKDDLESPDLSDCVNMAWVGHRIETNNPAASSASVIPGTAVPGLSAADNSYSFQDRPKLFSGFGRGSRQPPNRSPGMGGPAGSLDLATDPDIARTPVSGALLMLCPSCSKIAGLRELGRSGGKRHFQLECGGCGLKQVISQDQQTSNQ